MKRHTRLLGVNDASFVERPERKPLSRLYAHSSPRYDATFQAAIILRWSFAHFARAAGRQQRDDSIYFYRGSIYYDARHR